MQEIEGWWRYLRNVLRVGMIYRIRNMNIRRNIRNKTYLLERVDQNTFRRFGYMERMYEGKLMRKIYRADVDGIRRAGRPRRRWREGAGELVKWRSAKG